MGAFRPSYLPPTIDGDEWFERTLQLIDLKSEMSRYGGVALSPASALQSLAMDRELLRKMQTTSNQNYPLMGPDWVEEMNSLSRASTAVAGGQNYTGGVSVMSPSEALGSTSDTVIMSNLSSTSWDLRVPKIAFLGEEERHSLGILGPDSPIRDARHNLQHILHSAPEVIVLDPSMDESSPPAAPIREWISEFDPDESRGVGDLSLETDNSPRGLRQQEGKMIQSGKPAQRSPLNPSSISIPLDPHLQRDRERRQPTVPEEDGYLPDSAIQHILSLEKSKLRGKPPEGVLSPRENHRWPVVGGVDKNGNPPTIDPRPLPLAPSGSAVSDSRHGHLSVPRQDIDLWSPTRLQDWHRCPRMAWMTRELRAKREENQEEDVDSRTYGELIHNVHHDIIQGVLGLSPGKERDEGGLGYSSIRNLGLNKKQIMMLALESLDSHAPWLGRTDAVSTNRLRMLTGMNLQEWNSWLADPMPVPLAGRIGGIISAEFDLGDSAPIAIEWKIGQEDNPGIEISDGFNDPIKVRGWIDRVDLLPIDGDTRIWLNDLERSVAPIRIHGSGWSPRRIVAIRDLKTSESGSAINVTTRAYWRNCNLPSTLGPGK